MDDKRITVWSAQWLNKHWLDKSLDWRKEARKITEWSVGTASEIIASEDE